MPAPMLRATALPVSFASAEVGVVLLAGVDVDVLADGDGVGAAPPAAVDDDDDDDVFELRMYVNEYSRHRTVVVASPLTSS